MKLYSLLLIIFTAFIINACMCKEEHRTKPLTESDKNWLPYQVGDSLFIYDENELIGVSVVKTIRKGRRYNTSYGTCKYEDSESKDIEFYYIGDEVKFPKVLKIHYYENSLTIGDYYVLSSNSSMYGPFFLINSPKVDLVINDEIYTDVSFIEGKHSFFYYSICVKENVGLVQFTNPDSITFKVIKK